MDWVVDTVTQFKMLEEVYYRVFEFVILTLMFVLFGLYVVYLFVE